MSTAVLSTRHPTVANAGTRIESVDILRGVVMVLMAIDHVRVYSGLPAGGATFGIFFTRWITHFCAPAFLFLAGTSAFLYGRTHADLSRHLIIRGAWLVLLELTFLRVAWTFNLDFADYQMAGVIWVIGWCMIVMAGLAKLPVAAVGAVGVLIIAAHNLLDPYVGTLIPTLGDNGIGALWKVFYVGFFAGPIRFGADGPNLIVLYTIVPWIGVMAAGYAFGRILALEPERRNPLCLTIGLGATALFVVLRGFEIYGDPRPWTAEVQASGVPALLAFLDTSKYPASLLFLLMTLGPAIALIPLLDRARGAVARWLTVFGRVPFFFYLLHIPLIHALAMVVSKIRLGSVSPWLFTNHPMGSPPPPDGYVWSLPLLYLTWGVAVVILYFACHWFSSLKARRRDWWLLRYL
jgi:uncharacterized membrane protein